MLLDSKILDGHARKFHQALQADALSEAVSLSQQVSDARLASIIKEGSLDRGMSLLLRLGSARAGSVCQAMPDEWAARYLQALWSEHQPEALKLLAVMAPERAVAVMRILPEELEEAMLAALDESSRDELLYLRRFEPDSAGGQMSPNFLSVPGSITVSQVREAVRDAPPQSQGIPYIYIVDDSGKLKGVISLTELMLGRSGDPVETRMSPDVFAVRVGDPAIEAAQRIRTRNLKQLPVVDERDRLVGVIRIQRALEMLSHEVADEISILGAASPDESFFTPPRRSIGKRLPWMASNVFLNLGAVAVIASFEDVIMQVAILAAFLPMITDMGGNVGIQALSVSIRSMALGEARLRDVWKSLRKELAIGMVNGLALGLLFAVIVLIMQQNMVLALVAGVALACNVLVAGLVGGTIPFLIKRLGRDPAMMTGPVLTTITDITGVSIYLGLSTLFLASMLAL